MQCPGMKYSQNVIIERAKSKLPFVIEVMIQDFFALQPIRGKIEYTPTSQRTPHLLTIL